MKEAATSVPIASVRGRRARALAYLRGRPNLVRTIAVVTAIVLWEVFGRGVNPIFMSHPTAILKAFVELAGTGELTAALAQSLQIFVVGMAIAIVGGITIGLIIGKFWWAEYILDPFINAIYAIPRVALVPLLILWFGLEMTSKVVIVVSIAIFPILINTYSGVKDVRADLIEIGRAYSATETQIFFKIVVPAAVPFIMAGIRLSVGVGLIGMVVAEFFTAVSGLGGRIIFYGNQFATAKMLVPIIVLALMGVALTQIVIFIESRLSRWRLSERTRFE